MVRPEEKFRQRVRGLGDIRRSGRPVMQRRERCEAELRGECVPKRELGNEGNKG